MCSYAASPSSTQKEPSLCEVSRAQELAGLTALKFTSGLDGGGTPRNLTIRSHENGPFHVM